MLNIVNVAQFVKYITAWVIDVNLNMRLGHKLHGKQSGKGADEQSPNSVDGCYFIR